MATVKADVSRFRPLTVIFQMVFVGRKFLTLKSITGGLLPFN
jgi:hypothetical protein